MKNKKALVFVGIVAFFVAFIAVANANHSWGNYHWARTANPFTLELGDNVSSQWDASLNLAASDWSLSNVLDAVVAKGGSRSPKNCKANDGRVEICNSEYGNNGWLGIAQIWTIDGSHIAKGLVKVNDTYFDTPTYNTPEWRNTVMCQEIGHTFGLHHQDEDFYNEPLGTCMDYSVDPTLNQHPNAHDYEELELIYSHIDSFSTVGGSSDDGGNPGNGNGKGNGKNKSVAGGGLEIDLNDPSAWGTAVREDAQGRNSLYRQNLPDGETLFTFVIWAE